MNKLRILNMLQNEENIVDYDFLKNTDSIVKVIKNKEINPFEDEGIILIEKTIPYIDNIYRNPNKFIINEEEVVKIELAKRITTESIKDLAKNTNYIQTVDENGDVKPSKILNINKEEVYDTYENRLIYTLIQHMKFYIEQKREKFEEIINHAKEINDVAIQYAGVAKTNGKKIISDLKTNTVLNKIGIKNKKKDEFKKLDELEKKILALTTYDTYKVVEKKHITLISPPIRKTNLILKNVNFNYAMILWDYLQENMGVKVKDKPISKTLKQNNLFKKILDEIFMLQYISMSKMDEEEIDDSEKRVKKNLVNDVLEYANLSESELEKILSDKIEKTKFKDSMIQRQIRETFAKSFEKYKMNIK